MDLSLVGTKRLIIFTRYPQAGYAKTRLIPILGPEGAARLQRRMTERIVEAAWQIAACRPLTVEIRFEGGNAAAMQRWLGDRFCYRPQKGNDLGQRMHHALASGFRNQERACVLAGSDIPDLGTEILCRALDTLDSRDLVLGPAVDGGYYLVGLSNAVSLHKTRALFEDIPWGTASVLKKTLAASREAGLNVELLPKLRDLDRPEQLVIWKANRY